MGTSNSLGVSREGRWVLLLMVILTAGRMVAAGAFGLGDSEAYYWSWAQSLELSYYDHPPLVAYLIAAGTSLFGHTPIGVRFFFVILSALTSWLIYLLACEVFEDRRVGFLAVLLFSLTPVYAVGGLSATPDVPLGFLWCAFLLLFHRVLEGNSRGLALLLGLVLGAAFLAKYFALLLIPTVLLLLLRREYRHWFRRPEFYAAGLLALLCALPVLVWNHQHRWPSLIYHLTRHGGTHFSGQNLALFTGGQLLYLTPIFWAGYFAALFISARRTFIKGNRGYSGFIMDGSSGPRSRAGPWVFLFHTSAPTLAFFYLVCLWTREAEPHWPVMGYFPLLIAAAKLLLDYWQRLRGRRGRLFRGTVYSGFAFAFALLVLLHIHVLTPAFQGLIPERHRPRDLSNEVYGWPGVAERVLKIAAPLRKAGKKVFVLHYHYTKCGQLAFALKGRLRVSCVNRRLDAFDFLSGSKPLFGATAIYATDSVYRKNPRHLWRCGQLREVVPPLPIRRGGRLVRTFRFYTCAPYGGLLSVPGRE